MPRQSHRHLVATLVGRTENITFSTMRSSQHLKTKFSKDMDNATCLGNRIDIWLPPQVNLESRPLKAPANKTYLTVIISCEQILNKEINEIFSYIRK